MTSQSELRSKPVSCPVTCGHLQTCSNVFIITPRVSMSDSSTSPESSESRAGSMEGDGSKGPDLKSPVSTGKTVI